MTTWDTETLPTDGDVLDAGRDGFRIRVSIEHDPDYSINDYDSDGRISTVLSYHYDNHYSTRPDGFTGRARKLQVGRGEYVWWEPYADDFGYQDDAGVWQSAKWDMLPRDVQRKEADRIRDLVEYGFVIVALRLEEEVTDAFGNTHWVEVAGASCGGVDRPYPELMAELYAEVIAELDAVGVS